MNNSDNSEKNISYENGIILGAREEQMKFLQLFAPIDITINDFKQTINEQNKAIKKLDSLRDVLSMKLNSLEELKSQLINEQEKRNLKRRDAYEAYKKTTDDEIANLKKKLIEKEKRNNELSGYIHNFKKDISRLERRNQELEAQHKEDEERILAGFGMPVVVSYDDNGNVTKQQIADVDNSKALAEYKKQNELSQKQIKEMDGIIKNLNDKIGLETVPLKNIVDAIKEKAKYCGLKEAYGLFEQVTLMLGNVPAWQNNKKELKTFFDSLSSEKTKVPLIGSVENLKIEDPTINGPVYDISSNNNVSIGGKKDDEEE